MKMNVQSGVRYVICGLTALVVQLGLASSVADYEQQNLISLYDAVENAGIGLHDDNPSSWKDLKGCAIWLLRAGFSLRRRRWSLPIRKVSSWRRSILN